MLHRSKFCRTFTSNMASSPTVLPSEPRVLLVDDVEADRRLLADFLRRQKYRLYLGENGRDGFEKARYVVPDLILMDVRMPVCDGIAACRLLKSDPKTSSIPLIFLTAAAQPEDRVRGLSEGAVDYIAKPFNFEEVQLRMRIHLNAARRPEITAAPDTATDDQHATVDEAFFQAAQRILLGDLALTPSLIGLARAVGTYPRRLNEAFRKCAGVTVFDYLFEARMQEARRLLAETALEVQVIASDLGYGCAANFSTAFRERFGMPPRDYRKAADGARAGA